MPIFAFAEDMVWNEAADAVEFEVTVGDYVGTCRVPRRELRRFEGTMPRAERAVELCHLNRSILERVVEAKIRARALDADGHLTVTGRDLARIGQPQSGTVE